MAVVGRFDGIRRRAVRFRVGSGSSPALGALTRIPGDAAGSS